MNNQTNKEHMMPRGTKRNPFVVGREKLGITKAELARRAGVSVATITTLEAGGKPRDKSAAVHVLHRLGVQEPKVSDALVADVVGTPPPTFIARQLGSGSPRYEVVQNSEPSQAVYDQPICHTAHRDAALFLVNVLNGLEQRFVATDARNSTSGFRRPGAQQFLAVRTRPAD